MFNKWFPLLLSCILPLAESQSSTISNETPLLFSSKYGPDSSAFSGQFKVPENREAANSRMLSLHYVRFPAKKKSNRPPIVYLAGGPGGSGIGTAKWRRYPLFLALSQYADVIALDQRGTGKSNNLINCRSKIHVPLTQTLTDKEYKKRHQDALSYCLTFWQSKQIDVNGYSTTDSVADLQALRKHLGVKQLTLWGTSYGSHLALAASKAIPSEINKIIISSAEGLDQTIKLPFQTDQFFQRLQQGFNQQSSQNLQLATLIRRVHNDLENSPELIQLTDDKGTKFNFLLQRRTMQRISSAMISDPARAFQLITLYQQIDKGNFAGITKLLSRFQKATGEIVLRPMSELMDIGSGISPSRLKQVQEQAKTSLLADYLNPTLFYIGLKPELDEGDSFRKNPVSDIPLLLLSGTLDGRTYIDSQKQAVAGFKNRQEITIVNGGHNLFMSSPKVTQVIEEFVQGKPLSYSDIIISLPKVQ